MAQGNNLIKMNEKLNKNKIERFYQAIIKSYKPEKLKELYWGDGDEFNDLVKQADELGSKEDDVTITCKNGAEIELPRLLFDSLFRGEEYCVFNCPIGQRYKYKDYAFMELIESPIVNINTRIEKRGLFPITRDKSGNIKSCFFVKSEEGNGKDYDYPELIMPFFVSQMKDRLRTFEDMLPSCFINHFEPMKYVLKIKEEENNLLVKLLYKLGVNLGIVENNTLEKREISVQQEIQSILDNERNINLTNEYEENLDSLKFYISAIKNPNPYYRFLDAYHILESFFYKYFYNYVKNLRSNIDKAKLYNDIKQHTGEQQMLKLVIKNCFSLEKFPETKASLISIGTKALAERIGQNYSIEDWPVNNIEEFATKLSDLIYLFRNAIVHSTKSSRYIEKIEESPNLVSEFSNFTNILLKIVKSILEANVSKW